MAMDELTMLSFVGIYFLLLGNFVYSFYLSKKVYNLVGTVMEFLAYSQGSTEESVEPADAKVGTMERLMRAGMELHDTPLEEPAKEEEIQPLLKEETPAVAEAAEELEEEIKPAAQEETVEVKDETETGAQEELEELDEEGKEEGEGEKKGLLRI